MTYFDFFEFEPTKGWANSTYNKIEKKKYLVDNKLSESPYHIQAAGFKKGDITAEIKHGDLLHIKGERSSYGKMTLDFVMVIPNNVDKDTLELTVADGMITITFDDKREEAKKIKVK